MAIFTKDGKAYVVEGPNPLVKKQVPWDPSKLVFHNMTWEDITQKIQRPTRTRAAEPAPAPMPAAAAKEPPPPPAAAAQETAPAPQEPDRAFELPYIRYKVLCHCLPATVEQRADSLYGESWSRVKYGRKFVFPCVMISAGDLSLEFWTSDPKAQITEKSVVYPFSYEVHNQVTDSHDRVPYDDYRWWRVSSREPKEGGWLFTANPSDFQPDFSD